MFDDEKDGVTALLGVRGMHRTSPWVRFYRYRDCMSTGMVQGYLSEMNYGS